MRTTLDLDEVVLVAARSLAATRGISMGKVVSDLALARLRPPLPASGHSVQPSATAFPRFACRADARPLTAEDVRRALNDDA
ncbi:MAG: hypothetical protein N2483_05940 [Burkholderiaceae bacterium]|nr:hypothetical protein [Burkholderiaceae bacterium]